MKAAKDYIYEHRPIELILILIGIILLTFGVWSVSVIKRQDSATDNSAGQEPPYTAKGTVREIDAATEEELVDVSLIENDVEEIQAAVQFENAADYAGGAYDETTF